MTKKDAFNAEEWSTVVQGPLMAGMHVVTASRGGTIRESLAMGKVYQHARGQHGDSELLDELVSSPPAMDPGEARSKEEFGGVAKERIQAAATLVREKATPEESQAYGAFVKSVAEAAARAHKEGGVLGIGGKEVSPEEQAALDEVAASLG